MKPILQLLANETLALLHHGMRLTELHIKSPCEDDRCDSCGLQSNCQELFNNGATCPVYKYRANWQRVSLPQIEVIQSL